MLFGIPKTGIHKYRFLNDTAFLDYVITIIAACITTYITSIPLVLTTIIWFISGIKNKYKYISWITMLITMLITMMITMLTTKMIN